MIRRFKRTRYPGWCWYCETRFEDDQQIIHHQWERHFKCPTCGDELLDGPHLSAHCLQVHDEVLGGIPNSLPDRHNLELKICGMDGVPEDYAAEIDGREANFKNNREIAARREAQLQQLETNLREDGVKIDPITLPRKKVKVEKNYSNMLEPVAGPSTSVGPSTSSSAVTRPQTSSAGIIALVKQQEPMILDAIEESEQLLQLSTTLQGKHSLRTMSQLASRIDELTGLAEEHLIQIENADIALAREESKKTLALKAPVVKKPARLAAVSLSPREARAARRHSIRFGDDVNEGDPSTGSVKEEDGEMDVSLNLVGPTGDKEISVKEEDGEMGVSLNLVGPTADKEVDGAVLVPSTSTSALSPQTSAGLGLLNGFGFRGFGYVEELFLGASFFEQINNKFT